jgi:hypothetical protein
MKIHRRFSPVLFLLFATGSPTGVHAAEPPAPAEFELSTGTASYPIVLGQPFVIVTPSGEKVEAVLRAKMFLAFDSYGVKFEYPRALKVSAEQDKTQFAGDETTTVTVESDSDLIVFQVFPAPNVSLNLDVLLKREFAELSTAMQDPRRTKASKKTGKPKLAATTKAVRTFAGVERAGRKLQWDILGYKGVTEIYSWSTDTKTVMTMVQYFQASKKSFESNANIILDTLAIVPDKATPESGKEPAGAPAQ